MRYKTIKHHDKVARQSPTGGRFRSVPHAAPRNGLLSSMVAALRAAMTGDSFAGGLESETFRPLLLAPFQLGTAPAPIKGAASTAYTTLRYLVNPTDRAEAWAELVIRSTPSECICQDDASRCSGGGG